MKQIIENRLVEYKVINIDSNTTVLDFLKENNFSFRLQHVSEEKFEQLKNADKPMYIEYGNFIAGYGRLNGNNFRNSGGLKISDPTGKIMGSFIIEDERIIYDAAVPFYEERDAVVYGGLIYYTTFTMQDILLEELQKDKKYLIYYGETTENFQYIPQFEEVSREKIIEYATDAEKGKQALQKRICRYY